MANLVTQPLLVPRKKAPSAPSKPLDPFAVELGRRIDQAWDEAGFESRMAMFHATNLRDYNQLAKWCKGRAEPEVRSLAEIARVCRVSIDWLISGVSGTQALTEWLEGAGQGAPLEARRFLRSLPVAGYRVDLAFYDLAFQAWKLGLTADEAARTAHVTQAIAGGGGKP